MKKKYSIKDNKDVQAVLDKGKFFKSNSCILYVMKNATNKNNIAFLAGKKLGPAPIRNKAKRKMRCAMQVYWENIAKGYDIVLIARPFLIDKEQAKFLKDLEYLLEKHKILSEDLRNKKENIDVKKVGDVYNEKTT